MNSIPVKEVENSKANQKNDAIENENPSNIKGGRILI
jgi:hypothetical protein